MALPERDPALQDRLYLNDGKGNYVRGVSNLPAFLTNSTCIAKADIDKDGDVDLFVGGGYVNGKYPEVYESYLLINDGKGNFTNQPMETGSGGSIKDAVWTDMDGDQFPELIIAGEWRTIQVFKNENGELSDNTEI